MKLDCQQCHRKKRKDYTFRRQFIIEKPSIIPGCPGISNVTHITCFIKQSDTAHTMPGSNESSQVRRHLWPISTVAIPMLSVRILVVPAVCKTHILASNCWSSVSQMSSIVQIILDASERWCVVPGCLQGLDQALMSNQALHVRTQDPVTQCWTYYDKLLPLLVAV